MSKAATNISVETVVDYTSNNPATGMPVQTPNEKIDSSRNIAVCTLIAIGGLISGYDMGSIAGMFEMPKYQEAIGEFDTNVSTWAIPSWRSGLIIGGATCFGLFGCITFGSIAAKFGRRKSLMAASLTIISACVVQGIFHKTWPVVFVARLFSGFSIGGLSTVCPMFVGETASGRFRPLLVSFYQLLLTVGILLGQVVAFSCSFWNGHIGQYLVTLLVIVIFNIFLLISAIFILPESAQWLVQNGKSDKARDTLALAMNLDRNSVTVSREIHAIEKSVAASRAQGQGTFGDLFSTQNKILYRFLLGISIQMLQQFTGINYFFYYGTALFKEISTMNPFASTIILGSVNVIGTCLCLPMVAKFPRRTVLMTGSLFMFIAFVLFSCLGTFALYNSKKVLNPSVGIVMIILACMFVVAFAGSWAPCAFLVVSEMVPKKHAGNMISISIAASWLVAAILTFVSPILNQAWGYKVGFIHTFFTFISFAVVYFFVYETRGRTVEDVEEMIAAGVSARKSPKWFRAPQEKTGSMAV